MPTSGDVRLTSRSTLPAETSAQPRKAKHTDFPMPSERPESLSGLPGGNHWSKQNENSAQSVLV